MKKIKNRNQIQMLRFYPFKSKNFISLLSLSNIQRIQQRKCCVLQQQKKNVNKNKTLYHIFDRLHREEKGIFHTYTVDDTIRKETFCYYENEHIDIISTLPAMIDTHFNQTFYYKNNKQHREDKDNYGKTLPAEIRYELKVYMKNGKIHRDLQDTDFYDNALPALCYNEYMGDYSDTWYYKGLKHRDDKDVYGNLLPAHTWHGEDFEIKQFWINGIAI